MRLVGGVHPVQIRRSGLPRTPGRDAARTTTVSHPHALLAPGSPISVNPVPDSCENFLVAGVGFEPTTFGL